MNILSSCLKLAFVAATMLVLAVAPISSATVTAQPSRSRGSGTHLAAYQRAQGIFERGAAATPGDLDQNRPISAGPVIGLICAIAASSVALGIAFGIRRRIDRIAGPDPEKTDDD